MSEYDRDFVWRDGTWCWDRVYQGTPWGHYYTRAARRHIDALLRSGTVRSVLDVGAGTGRFALPLRARGLEVTAVDLDERALLELSGKEPSIRTLPGDFMEMAVPPHDALVCVGTAKYVRDFEGFVARCHAALNPGGLLLLEMRNPDNVRARLRGLTSRLLGRREAASSTFATELAPRACRDLLEARGFDVLWTRGSALLTPGHSSRRASLFRVADAVERALRADRLSGLSPQYYVAARRAPASGLSARGTREARRLAHGAGGLPFPRARGTYLCRASKSGRLLRATET